MADRIRLDRFLAEAGIGSRAEVKKMTRAGRIQVNRKPAGQSDLKIDPDQDEILADGKPVRREALPVIMLNKPAGVVSATTDAHDRTVIDLIREPWADQLFPVGRLDKDTEGLLLLTGDGKMSHALLSPKRHVVKTYFAVVSGEPDHDLIREFQEGLEIGEKRRTLPAELVFLNRDGSVRLPEEAGCEEAENEKAGCKEAGREEAGREAAGCEEPGTEGADCEESGRHASYAAFGYKSIPADDYNRCGDGACCVIVSITEGKFHQIKRMFGAAGREVLFLKRIAMGGLMLDPALAPGEYRPLTGEELNLLVTSTLCGSRSGA